MEELHIHTPYSVGVDERFIASDHLGVPRSVAVGLTLPVPDVRHGSDGHYLDTYLNFWPSQKLCQCLPT